MNPSPVTAVHVYRTAMCGGGMSYDVWVPLEAATPEAVEKCTHQIWSNGRKYLTYEDATAPVGHRDMDPGIERWEAWCAHEKAARVRMLAILHDAYPETRCLTEYPRMWTFNLLPAGQKETHGRREIAINS